MKLKTLAMAALGAAVGVSAMMSTAPAMADQFIPGTVYRSGPYAPGGIPFADGYADYIKLVNKAGGVNGVKIAYEECDTGYNTAKGVECYEKLKGKGPTGAAGFQPLSTGITYAITEKATADKIPVHSMGYGRAAATIGSVFPYVFTFPVTYWAGADAIVQYITAQEGGSLKGKKIALVYHDSAYGKEPIATLEARAAKAGFKLSLHPVSHPGLEQKATWLTIGRKIRPDYVIMWGWGVMNSTALKEAHAVRFPMDKFIGVWWSGNEPDVLPAGDAAIGYKAAQFTSPGNFPVIEQARKLYDSGEGTAKDVKTVGSMIYNRGVAASFFIIEALKTAQAKFGNKEMTGEQMQYGFENLDITQAKIDAAGLTGMITPFKVSCNDHEGGGQVRIFQWDGKTWNATSEWLTPNRDMLRPMYEADAAKYAKEKGVTPTPCN